MTWRRLFSFSFLNVKVIRETNFHLQVVHTGFFEASFREHVFIKTPMKHELEVWTGPWDFSPIYFVFGDKGWSVDNNRDCYFAPQDANGFGMRKIHCPFDCS